MRKKNLKLTLSLGDFFAIGIIGIALALAMILTLIIARISVEIFPVRDALPAETLPRTLDCADWEPKEPGSFGCFFGEEQYLQLGPNRPWSSMQLRSGTLPELEKYRWLQFEVWVPPEANFETWFSQVYISYENLEFRGIEITSDDPRATRNRSFSGDELIYLLTTGDWLIISIPLRIDELGEIRMFTVTSFRELPLRIRNMTLVP